MEILQKQRVVAVVLLKQETQTALHLVEMVVQSQLLVLLYFTAAVAVVENFQLVQLVEMAAVETALHQVQEQAVLLTQAAVAVVVELLEHLVTAVQAVQVL